MCRLPLYVFRIILKDTSSIFIDSLRFYLSLSLSVSLSLSLSLSLKMLGKMFRFIVLRLENALVSQKNWVNKFLLLYLRQNSPQGSYHHFPSRGKLLIHPQAALFQKSISPSWNGAGRNYVCIYILYLYIHLYLSISLSI